MSKESTIQWYKEKRQLYAELATLVATTLASLLRSKNVGILSITSRAKDVASLAEKINRKDYKEPKIEISDLAGIRVIAYLETEITTIVETIKKTFEVIDSESLDKSRELGTDRIGYRSFHFVCRLGGSRDSLPEYEPYKGLKFEIQVRTVLQHAWAEIEHDRNYKFAGLLPPDIRRRLFLIAGMLELADREFAGVSSEIESLSKSVTKAVKKGELDSAISTVSLIAYMKSKSDSFKSVRIHAQPPKRMETVANEIINFGLHTLADLDALIERNRASLEKAGKEQTYSGFIRDALMLDDIEKYFSECWAENWQIIDSSSFVFHAKHNKFKKTKDLISGKGIQIMDIEYEPPEA
jgi:putative GTP pyrophosphokinase